jgi:hypothetical protein
MARSSAIVASFRFERIAQEPVRRVSTYRNLTVPNCRPREMRRVMSQLRTEPYVMLKPELHVPNAAQVFDANGTLQDESLREFIQTYVDAVIDWMTQRKTSKSVA